MIEQRSREWFEARRGKPTASGFSKIMTSKLEPSKQQDAYLDRLLSEKLGGALQVYASTNAMQIGTEREPHAVAAFEVVTGLDVEEAGFELSDCGRYGCSPDGYVLNQLQEVIGTLELKCPLLKTHEGYLSKGVVPPKYLLQLRGQMIITGLSKGYFVSYHPDSELLVVEIESDYDFDKRFLSCMEEFCDRLDARFQEHLTNIF